jgi:WD40 repeat protein/mono/diheme cytochrome c family protein
MALHAVSAAVPPADVKAKASYYQQVRPLFQARCQGCHQPAKTSGGYLMTQFSRLLEGGASGKKAVVPGQPDKSRLVELITPVNGKAKMPMSGKPLAAGEIALVRSWIAQGAEDDSAAYQRARFDMEHPPVYTRQPVVTSLDFSPDGKLLAVSGFNEVLLMSADGSQRVARLVGGSERVQSARFSPDGKLLAVTAGQPARSGEVQVWDVAQRKLLRAVPVSTDTPYGASWSPDGKRIAFGCVDNTLRAIEASTGQQVLQQGSHTDWVLDTAWSTDGSHLVSVSRDFTTKLTEAATQRFIDNITSITPGALKGGVEAVARHPQRDEIVVGGSDGVPQVFRLYRTTKRVIGDNANLVRELPALKGRIHSVAVSPDGTRIAAGSSLDGAGEVAVFAYDFDKGGETKTLCRTQVPQTAVYAVAFQADGKTVAAAGADGIVRLIDVESGKVSGEFAPAPVGGGAARVVTAGPAPPRAEETLPAETLPAGSKLYALEAQPKTIQLKGPFDYAQLVVTGRLQSGESVDLTRMVQAKLGMPVAFVSKSGLVQPKAEGRASLLLSLGGVSATVPVTVSGMKSEARVDYVRDVQPVLSKAGCTSGTCHGAAKGKNGFKLSLRGYDPLSDVRALTDDLASRRVNLASPEDSLTLLKPAAEVPHTGGQVFHKGDTYYQILRNWIASGATLAPNSLKATGIEVFPKDPTVQRAGSQQQVRVVATYPDGSTRDVTREAFVDSGNMEVATGSPSGLVTALRRGEAPLLVRYEGSYAATTLTVMGDRSGFAWKQPPANNKIDELAAAKWKRMKIQPSELCSDTEFIRRVYLDLTGLPPTADEVRAFTADSRPTRVKRDELVDRLVGSKPYVEYWTNKWADLLQVNRKFLGTEGAIAFRSWIRAEVEKNTPYDQFAREILTASGSNRENPAASYFKILRDPASTMENTTQLFLAVRFNCNKCHDHPFERWTQDQYYQLSAYFSQVGLQKDPASGDRTVGGTAVEGAKPLFEVVADTGQGEVKHERTGQVTPPKFPYAAQYQAPPQASRRSQLAAWITSKDNPYFAKSYVNRLWGYLFGTGIIEPIDDSRAGNPATNPELLDYLTREFINGGFDVRQMVKLICKSRTYQLALATNRWNADDRTNYSHAMARRLPAEVLYDAVSTVTGAVSKIPGVPPGTRAAELPDSGGELPGGFLATFGRPVRESACECERTSGMQLGPVMALISGPTIADAIADPENALTKLVAKEPDDAKVVNELFTRILNRPATGAESKAYLDALRSVDADHLALTAAVKKREEEVKALRVKQEKEREDTIAATKAELEAYQKELVGITAEREKQRAARVAEAEAKLKAYEATLPPKLAEWEKKQSRGVKWTPLDPAALSASNGSTLAKQPDLSVTASGKEGKGAYTFTAQTDLQGITAVRLEVLPEPSLKNNGPGRAPDGNFVLTEFEATAAPASDPKKAAKVMLQNGLADFSQEGFAIAQVVDGNPNGDGGWAISPSYGVPHWATFQTATPAGYAGGTVLTFTLHQQFGRPEFSLGRFRISVATEAQPVGLSLPDELKAVLDVAPEQRSAAQQEALMKYYRAIDPGLREKLQETAEVRRPLPPDPKLKDLEERLAYVSRPVPEDGRLAQLRQDVRQSEQQMTNRRLTVAQDLAWALINSPAFLFNH